MQETDSEYENQERLIEIEEANVNKKKRKAVSILIEIALYLFLFFICVYIIPNFVLQRTIVDGPSMEDTLHNDENLLVEKISYRFDWLKRFDIIVFYPFGREQEDYFVKRIIGLPGETVQIIGETIYINGLPLSEDFGKDPITNPGIAKDPLLLEDDEYFVMGDNRSVSEDSRFARVGPVRKEDIGGRAIFRVWPLNKFGFID